MQSTPRLHKFAVARRSGEPLDEGNGRQQKTNTFGGTLAQLGSQGHTEHVGPRTMANHIVSLRSFQDRTETSRAAPTISVRVARQAILTSEAGRSGFAGGNRPDTETGRWYTGRLRAIDSASQLHAELHTRHGGEAYYGSYDALSTFVPEHADCRSISFSHPGNWLALVKVSASPVFARNGSLAVVRTVRKQLHGVCRCSRRTGQGNGVIRTGLRPSGEDALGRHLRGDPLLAWKRPCCTSAHHIVRPGEDVSTHRFLPCTQSSLLRWILALCAGWLPARPRCGRARRARPVRAFGMENASNSVVRRADE
ncbi:hypothetical protein OH76DRAFT_703147 [Lentinus brumalis]|uniref:Uncharacterized protein n=1 Tax=Lentinus brumalis TaxID=2498619 RepID=A0A371D5Q1_9APHY|nr:hypothetical protein OH76DRAFT_703147 [Polyporus brumalis]